MLTSKLAAIATLTFAVAANAAPTVQAPTGGKQSLRDAVRLANFQRSPINLNHDFKEVPNTTVTLRGCTKDQREATVRGTIMVDTNELTAKGKTIENVDVRPFGNTLQTAFADRVKLFNGKDLKEDGFSHGFEGFGDVMKGASIDNKAKTGITMTLIERQITVGGVNSSCPKQPQF